MYSNTRVRFSQRHNKPLLRPRHGGLLSLSNRTSGGQSVGGGHGWPGWNTSVVLDPSAEQAQDMSQEEILIYADQLSLPYPSAIIKGSIFMGISQSEEFVLTTSGTIDFGEIPEDVARSIKRQAGKIRLRIGKQVNGDKENFGELHINRPSRLIQLVQKGYQNARDAAERICHCFYEIYDNGVGLILRTPDNMAAYICIEKTINENWFYDIKTISPANDRFFKRKKRLWQKPPPFTE